MAGKTKNKEAKTVREKVLSVVDKGFLIGDCVPKIEKPSNGREKVFWTIIQEDYPEIKKKN